MFAHIGRLVVYLVVYLVGTHFLDGAFYSYMYALLSGERLARGLLTIAEGALLWSLVWALEWMAVRIRGAMNRGQAELERAQAERDKGGGI